jgi:hydroxyacylglutathione hydrolase
MYLQQFFVEGLGHASYLIGSDQTNEALVVDPRRDIAPYLEAASRAGLRIRYVLETHLHNDFLSGARALAERLGSEHLASAEAGHIFPHRAVRDGDEVRIGELLVQVLSTPGHTPEHVSYVVVDTARAEVPVLVFTGGDLLVGSVGRPDLLGVELGRELAPRLYDSLFGKLLKLEDYVEVLPTHGAGSLCGRSISSKRTTTIGYERRFNPFLQRTAKDEFVDFVLQGNPFVPAYYKRMRPGNLAGCDAFVAAPPLPLSVEDVQHALGHDAIALDTRSPGAFGGGHIPGAYNVGVGPMLATWVGSLLPHDAPMVLVLERADDWEQITNALGRIGYERVIGYLQGGMASWQERGLPLARVAQIDAEELDRWRRTDPALQVVDVRMPSEWETGTVPGARLVTLSDLPGREADLDPERPTAVICGSGYRSSIATAFLRRHGLKKLTNVLGGMAAYDAAGLEKVRPGALARAARPHTELVVSLA